MLCIIIIIKGPLFFGIVRIAVHNKQAGSVWCELRNACHVIVYMYPCFVLSCAVHEILLR